MSLITAYEVLKYSPAGPTYPTGQFCELIPQIEEELERECLGDLYAYLVTKLRPYPNTAVEWSSECSGYNKNDLVMAGGCTFQSLVNYNQTDPLADNSDWAAFERFTDSYANTFWKAYLRRLLALKVYLSSLTFETWQTGSTGLIVRTGGYSSDIRSGSKSELFEVKTATQKEADRVMGNMVAWLKDNYETAGFPQPNVCSDCTTSLKRSRRFNFR